MKKAKVLVSLLLVAGLLLTFPVHKAQAVLDDVNAKAAVLMEAGTGTILYEKNAHERRASGSVTKIMSLLLIMEALDSGQITLEDQVTTSEFANSMGGSEIWLEVGEVMTVDDLLKAVAVQSANDATVALAEHVAGSEAAFLEMMNNKAAELGMQDTHFLNTTGFDEEGQYTSAYDIALMARELIKHEKIFEYSGIWMTELRGGKTELANTNKLLKTYQGITGLKTGTTDDAGNCFCGTAQRGDLKLISVVLGCETSKDRFNATTTLLDYGFDNWSVATPSLEEGAIQPVPVLNGMQTQVQGVVELDQVMLVSKGQEGNITHEVVMTENVEAPVEKGQVLGKVVYKLGEQELCAFPIKAVEAVEPITFGAAFHTLFIGVLGL